MFVDLGLNQKASSASEICAKLSVAHTKLADVHLHFYVLFRQNQTPLIALT